MLAVAALAGDAGNGPFAVLAEPTPAWIAVPGFIVVVAIVIVFASLRIRRMQISYSGE